MSERAFWIQVHFAVFFSKSTGYSQLVGVTFIFCACLGGFIAWACECHIRVPLKPVP